jgi:hypothetical protein
MAVLYLDEVQHWGVALIHWAIFTAIACESNCLGVRDFSYYVKPRQVRAMHARR